MKGFRGAKALYALLLAPVIAALLVPTYARVNPVLGGFPFFYWYQLGWVLLGGLATGIVYRAAPENDE